MEKTYVSIILEVENAYYLSLKVAKNDTFVIFNSEECVFARGEITGRQMRLVVQLDIEKSQQVFFDLRSHAFQTPT